VIEPIPPEAREVLEGASFCYLAARSTAGPHLTPLVYAVHASRLWVTTSRRSVKARLWKRDPAVGGLVRSGDRSLTFAGSVRTFDLLDPGTWAASAVSAPRLTFAAAAFTRRNARFFAGYAVDAPRVPLAWSPPGRVFTEVGMEWAAILGDGVRSRWGSPNRRVRSVSGFRSSRSGKHPLRGLPAEVRDRVGEDGDGTLALDGPGGLIVLPVRWATEGGAMYAALSEGALAFSGGGPVLPGSLAVDRASRWRARAMVGALARGQAYLYVLARLGSGRAAAARLLHRMGLDDEGSVLVKLVAERVVWWRGWSTGTVVT
jgi:Pyridoxamine 5'-phosphate oxidase